MPRMATSNRVLAVVSLSYFVAILFLNSQSNLLNVVQAAHPRRRVTIRRNVAAYDREITTFTEDGRLAQVEYGLEAALRGSLVAAIQVNIPSTREKDDSHDCVNDDENGKTMPKVKGLSSSCTVVCIEKSSYGKMHRIDDHIWMLTAGLAGDARMLANQARRACQNHRLQYGEAATTQQAARMTAEFYHELTRTGGCRPLGCTSILIGVDDTTNTCKLFRTDPGGGIEECRFCAAGDSHEIVAKELMNLVESFDSGSEPESSKVVNHQNQESICRSIASIATTMAGKVLRLLDRSNKSRKGTDEEEGTTFDVWTIQPMKHRRGGMLATCYSDVRQDNVNNILLQYL